MESRPANTRHGYCRGTLSIAQEATFLREELAVRMGTPLKSLNVPIGFRIAGSADHGAIAWAWRAVLARHPSLRTDIVPSSRYDDDHRQLQLAAFGRTSSFLPGLFEGRIYTDPTVDLVTARTRQPDDRGAMELVQEVARMVSSSSLSTGSHPTLTIVSAPHAAYVIGALSHASVDGWSFRLIGREFCALYSAAQAGTEPPRLNVPQSFSDFARANNDWVFHGDCAAHVAFWKDQWENACSHQIRHAHLPFSAQRIEPGHVTGTAKLTISGEDAERLRYCLHRTRVTPHVLFRTAFLISLAAATGCNHVACWSNFANRRDVHSRTIVGRMATRHLLGFAIQAQSCEDACQAVARQLRSGQAYESLSSHALMCVAGLSADDIDTSVTFDSSWPGAATAFDDAPITTVPLAIGKEWIDFEVRVGLERRTFGLAATFNRNRYDAGGVEQFLELILEIALTIALQPRLDVRGCVDIARRQTW